MTHRDWPSVDSLEAAGLRVVDWLEGRIRTLPSHLGPPSRETRSIAEDLRLLNARGDVVTDNSQPGLSNVWGRQRATVQGLATEVAAQSLGRRARRMGMLWEDCPVFEAPENARGVPVTQGITRGLLGNHSRGQVFSARDMAFLIGSIDVPIQTVASWRSFCAVDLRWGRRRALWEVLTGAAT